MLQRGRYIPALVAGIMRQRVILHGWRLLSFYLFLLQLHRSAGAGHLLQPTYEMAAVAPHDHRLPVRRHGHEGQSGMIVSTITISQTIGDDVKQLQPIHGPHDRVSAIACRVHQLYIIVVQQHS